MERARDYAHALGSDITDLVELADARLLSDARGPIEATAMAAAGGPLRAWAREAAPDEFTFDIAPAKQTISATVEARFRIAQPDLTRIEPRNRERA